MAKTKEEPWVKVSEQIVSNPPAGVGDDAIVIGGVIIAPCGPSLARITSGPDFLRRYTSNGTIPRNAHISLINAYYLSQITPLVIARATNAKMYGGVIISSGLEANNCYFDENNEVLDKSAEFSITGIPCDSSGNLTDFNLAIEDIIIYAGTMPELTTTINLYEVKTIEDVVSVLTNLGGYYFSGIKIQGGKGQLKYDISGKVYSQQGSFNYGNVSTNPSEDQISDISTNSLELEVDPEIPAETERIMALISQEYSGTDDIEFSLKKSGSKFLLQLHDSKNEGRYFISFDPESTDSSGISDYADELNDMGFSFKVVVFDNAKEASQTATTAIENHAFGSSSFDATSSESSTNVCNALSLLETQELYDIDGLCLFGLQSTSDGAQITKQFNITGANNKWFLPIGVPWKYTNRRTIANWVEGLNLPEPNPVPGAIVFGPFDKDISTVGWYVYIDAGVKYWERVVVNANAGQEFAPIFKDTYGRMNMTDPTLMLKKDDRELLLARTKPINWMQQNPRTLVYYLNQNWTYSNDDNVCEEENVVRTIWKISRDVDQILEQFFAKYNSRSTRKQVEDLVDYYFRWNIMNKEFAPETYHCICDESNNTDEIIRAHKLAVLIEVRYYGSIKWIECLNRAYPIGVDFSGEM